MKTVMRGSKSVARKKRRNYSPAFKAKVALAAMEGPRP
jgi:transposase-like protein